MASEEIKALQEDLRISYIELELQNQQLLERELQLQTVLAEYQGFFELSPVAILLVDRLGKILKQNTASRRLFGQSNQSLGIQQRVIQFFKDAGFFTRLKQELLKDEQHSICTPPCGVGAYSGETYISMLTGEERLVSIDVVEQQREGEESRLLISMLDITDQRRLQQAKEQLIVEQEVHQRKDEFLASMSHELRTPLTAIIGVAEHIMEDNLCGSSECPKDDVAELLKMIHSAGTGQLALVNDILDMSKIESGKFKTDNKPYSFSHLLDHIKHIFDVHMQDKGLDWRIEQKNSEQFQLVGDAQRIAQILINLLGNAVKFTEQGRITLTTHSAENRLYFTVEDTGIGMLPETMEKFTGVPTLKR